ncbi:MAG: LptE family protein [Bacteroidales bacterium]|nr:LptE family protein [Bacteroidales bacterium]
MKPLRKLLALAVLLPLAAACGIYSFSGTSIQPDVKTITINYIENKALKVNPSLSNELTEQLRLTFRRMTRLEQVDLDGDLEISGEITGYEVAAQAISAQEVAAQNRLTVTVKLTFVSRKYPEDGFENKSFTGYADYDAVNPLDAVEGQLCNDIIQKIVDDIFNATVAQW